MWPKKYKDYPVDEPLIKNRVEPGKGIIGAEMHEINGWGTTLHQERKKEGFLSKIFSSKDQDEG